MGLLRRPERPVHVRHRLPLVEQPQLRLRLGTAPRTAERPWPCRPDGPALRIRRVRRPRCRESLLVFLPLCLHDSPWVSTSAAGTAIKARVAKAGAEAAVLVLGSESLRCRAQHCMCVRNTERLERGICFPCPASGICGAGIASAGGSHSPPIAGRSILSTPSFCFTGTVLLCFSKPACFAKSFISTCLSGVKQQSRRPRLTGFKIQICFHRSRLTGPGFKALVYFKLVARPIPTHADLAAGLPPCRQLSQRSAQLRPAFAGLAALGQPGSRWCAPVSTDGSRSCSLQPGALPIRRS